MIQMQRFVPALKSLEILIFHLKNKLVNYLFPFPIMFRKNSGKKKYIDSAFNFYRSGKIIYFMEEKKYIFI